MEYRWKKELANYYEAPKPQRKQAFIRQFGVPKMNLFYLTWMQAKYISKWTWISSICFFGMVYGMSLCVEKRFTGVVFAIIPFWVMISVTESVRSYRYRMEELELSTRFSLKSIVMARLLMLGIVNLTIVASVGQILQGMGYIHMLHILTPYFLSTSGGLYLVRKIHGNENTLYCFCLAALISICELIIQWEYQKLFLPDFTLLWGIVCIVGVVLTVRESYQTIRMAEDLAWS